MRSQRKNILPLSLATLGIVYGDLGTSPLYAVRESLKGIPVIPENIYGILSLIFWSLIFIISIKYVIYVLRADNDGEGGVLALLALIKQHDIKAFKIIFTIGILGTAFLIGDGMLTPAISVISAIEGLQVISPAIAHLTLPCTFFILLMLFMAQHFGTAKIGNLFGPILLVWFITIGVLGAISFIQTPSILQSIHPYYAFQFFMQNGWKGYALLGGVFLVLTGGEALYADLGQFGRIPIRLTWFGVVLPSLLLNYFGQGAILLREPEKIINPFYSLAPPWFYYPLLIIATLSAIIASQAVISATFSLTKQAIMLDFYPKVPLIQTSAATKGQVYVPQMNFILTIGTLGCVVGFQSSGAMAYAYGIAVNLNMVIVTSLLLYVAHHLWQWSYFKITLIFVTLLSLELGFLGSNLQKIWSGGWVPILFAMICALMMTTWYNGIQYLRSSHYSTREQLKDSSLQTKLFDVNYIPKSLAVFITDPYDPSGGNLFNFFKLNHIMPEHILILSLKIANKPYIPVSKRYEIKKVDKKVHRLILHIGFMQLINIPRILSIGKKHKIFPFALNLTKAIYFIEITNISVTRKRATLPFMWQERLFAFLMRNSALDIEFYHLPYNRTVAIGNYCEI